MEAGESEEVARRYASMVEAEKERLRNERKRERLDKLRQRSTTFVQPSVPATFDADGNTSLGRTATPRTTAGRPV